MLDQEQIHLHERKLLGKTEVIHVALDGLHDDGFSAKVVIDAEYDIDTLADSIFDKGLLSVPYADDFYTYRIIPGHHTHCYEVLRRQRVKMPALQSKNLSVD